MIRFLQTPGPLKKIILGGLLLVICAAMVVTLVPWGNGSNFGFGGPAKGVVATVGGETVTATEVQRAAQRLLEQQMPQGASAQAAMLLPYFTSQAAQILIDDKAILVEARRLGFHASDEEVRDEIQHGPQYAAAFFPGGNFVGQEQYEAILQQHDLTVPAFEQDVKDQILYGKLHDLVTGAATVSQNEIRTEFDHQNTKVKFDYAVLSKDEIAKSVQPTDAELKAYFQANQRRYANSIPAKRKLRYVLLSTDKLEADMQVTPQQLQDYYSEHRDEYRVPDQVNISQILIKTPLPGPDGKVDSAGTEAARKKADDVLQQLRNGGNFADLAKKYSEDPSAKDGGSLGWMEASRFPSPEVQAAAQSLAKGATSGVINAGYAFVILHVDDRQSAHVKSLAEVKDQIAPLIRQQAAAQAADTEARALLTQARTAGLEKAAAAKGLQVVNTDFVSQSDTLPGIGSSPQFMQAVFAEAEKSPADEVQLPQGYAIFEIVDSKPPATPTFEEIRSKVETDLRNERASALLSQKTHELSDRAKAEHDLKKAAKELGATIKTSDFVLPDGQVPDIGSMSGPAAVAFSMRPGDISGPIVTNTGGAVLSLVEKQAPSAEDFAAKSDQIRDAVLQNKQAELFGLFRTSLRERMEKSGKIKINQDELNSLTHNQNSEQGE